MEPTRSPKLAPYLAVRDAPGLVKFIEEGIGGRVTYRVDDPEGRIAHLELTIADSVVMVGESPPGRPQFAGMIHLYVPDADAAFARARKAGATEVRAPADDPQGDRRGGVRDGWGNEWWFTRMPPGH
jgi:PhnB protein